MPNFLLKYRWQIQGGAKTTAWTSLVVTTNAASWTTGTLNQITHAAAITPPTGAALSDVIEVQVFRDTGNDSGLFAADPYTATVGITFIDFHIEVDTTGSRTEYSK